MGLGINAYSQPYANTVGGAASYTNTKAATGETKSEKAASESGAAVEFSDAGRQALENSKETADKVVKTETAASKISAKVGKMSESERSDLVAKLQSDQEARQSRMMDMVQQLFNKQVNAYGQSNDMWQFLASGKFTVDAATKAQAQADISEDGYYGVKQTSERMFEFAMALTGGDVDKMKEMQTAVEKGYKQAEKIWGGKLPDISKQTLDATNQLFDDYYKQQESMALVCCFFVVVFALIFQCAKSFGPPVGRYFAFLPYFRKYPKLAIGGFAYILGLYCPNIIYWFFSGIGEQISIFRTAPSFDMAMFLAFAVNMPSLIIFVVKVETAFYEKFVLYVSALNNGTLHMLQKERDVMTRTLLQELFFVYEVQLIITVVLVCLISVFFPYLDASIQMLHMFVMLSLGVCVVFCMYFTIVVFYYFSDYGGACVSSCVFLVTSVLGAVMAVRADEVYLLPLPLLMGGLCGWFVSFLLLRHRMEKLDSFLMC